jgi:hypothetical protein
MTRINLLVARVVLLGICILCISSVSVWAEEVKISVTAYTLKECYHNKGKTASGEIGSLVNRSVNRHQAANLSIPLFFCFITPSTNVFP